jgi:hypothetical protein
MAIHKAKVIGQLEVGGVAPGGTVEIDDERVNLRVLLDAQLVELLPEPKKKATGPKGGA